VRLQDVLSLPDGPEKTAALVAWLQGLYEDEASIPVLVGGAAVELFTGGGYTTGDLDFVGEVPDAVARRLSDAGFKRKGRHWIHHEGQVFLEFPGDSLEADEEVIALEVAGQRIRVLAPELPTGLERRRPRSYLEWKTLRRWGKLPSWEGIPPGYLLRGLREEAGWTQYALARRLECSQQAIAQAERWETNPTVKFIRTWADALGYELSLEFRKRPSAGVPMPRAG
jgi:DNA-binding XRE family transcriptional regulator